MGFNSGFKGLNKPNTNKYIGHGIGKA